MAKVKSKGTVLKQVIATTYTAVAQIISIDLPDAEGETYESDTLDNSSAGIPYDPTGRSEGGSCGFELFLDPALEGHQAITDLITTPAACEWQLTFADTGESVWNFKTAGVSFGGAVALNDGLKATVSGKLSGIPVYPT